MLRHLGAIAVSACIVATLGCEGKELAAPDLVPDPNLNTVAVSTVAVSTVAFGGRVVDADTGRPVTNARVSLAAGSNIGGGLYAGSTQVFTTSGEDGTYALPLALPIGWRFVSLEFTSPAGYDDTAWTFEPAAPPCRAQTPCFAAADRPVIKMYPTLVIRPGESIDVRVDDVVRCGWQGYMECRRVLVSASPDDAVELEIVPRDSSKPMALVVAFLHTPWVYEWDQSVRRVTLPPGAFVFVAGTGSGTLTARR